VCAALGIDGVATAIERPLPMHVGLGSGTQTALALATAASHAAGDPVDARAVAPQLGRGGRSGIGVAAFEAGGFIIDAGQPTDAFTATVPPSGSWEVPAVAHRATLPATWRFVLVRPTVRPGRSGADEETAMRAVVEAADAAPAAAIDAVIDEQLLPAVDAGDLHASARRSRRSTGTTAGGTPTRRAAPTAVCSMGSSTRSRRHRAVWARASRRGGRRSTG
jgi:Predicted archaeal sugar kinases